MKKIEPIENVVAQTKWIKQQNAVYDDYVKGEQNYTKLAKKHNITRAEAIKMVEEVNTYVRQSGAFKEMAKEAAALGFDVVWEFEPGFMINEPKNVIELVDAVDEPNFSLLFDTCHAYNCAMGHRHLEPGLKLGGGIMEFIRMCKDRIGLVHVIDSDGTLNDTGTSTHAPFGDGFINFDEVIPALLHEAGYQGDWWAIDLCEWPDAWAVAEDCYRFVDKFNRKFGK